VIRGRERLGRIEGGVYTGVNTPFITAQQEPIVKRKAFPLKRNSDRKPNNEASNISEEINLDVKLKTN